MSARAAMLAAIRANRPDGVHELPAMPPAPPCGDDLVALFAERLQRMGGRTVRMGDPWRERLSGTVCSLVPEYGGSVSPDADDMAALAKVDVVIARAACGVAETGSVLFTEAQLQVNAVVYLAQHLVVLLDPAAILPDFVAAYQRAEFRLARYAVFHTGPSATADIEGVLIHGAQGVRSLTVVLG